MIGVKSNRRTILWAGVVIATLCPVAVAHHILGVPHYSYGEDYPQTPVLTYRVDAGPYEVKMTGYPGRPKPGERCSLHVYLSRLDNGAMFDGNVTMTVMQDNFLRPDPIIYGPMEAQLEEALFKFFPEFEEEANYIVRIEYFTEGAPWIIDLPMVAGEPGSPWAVIGGFAGGLLAFLVVVRAIRIKMQRRVREKAKVEIDSPPAPDASIGEPAQ